MPDLRPFRGLRYDTARVPDLSTVLCPPYDVISPSEREQLLALDPANAVRLELPSATTQSATPEDFTRAASTLEKWLADGTLARDEHPLIYIYEQQYTDNAGASRVARSFFCELRLAEYDASSGVRPHELTMSAPREHRFQLLSAVRTHLSPVLLLYPADTAELIDAVVASARPREFVGPDGNPGRLWGIDPDLVPEALELLALASARPLSIADGHHRYETALRYRDTPRAPPSADHVLALLYEADSGGLALAPWHRVIAGVADPAAVLGAARQLYSARGAPTAAEVIEAVEGAPEAGVIGAWTREGGAILTVNRALAGRYVAGVASSEVRWLDVSVLSGTLERMIGSTEAELTAQGRLAYTHDSREAVAAVDGGEADVCFLLRPTPVDEVLAVAAAGDYMPPKSTYFYPKAATGLVFDPLF